jgi:hypothetical protein
LRIISRHFQSGLSPERPTAPRIDIIRKSCPFILVDLAGEWRCTPTLKRHLADFGGQPAAGALLRKLAEGGLIKAL